MRRKYIVIFIITICVAFLLARCGKNFIYSGHTSNAPAQKPIKVKVLLDWIPNTNHTGIYVAKDKGFYAEQGIDVDIVQPSDSGSIHIVAANKAEFGISYQGQVIYARASNNPLPVKAVAAIMQHNTSGFASPVSSNIKSPKDFENKRYGAWGSPVELEVLKSVMKKYNADFSKLRIINMGKMDFFMGIKRDIDFAWIYYGWDGIEAELKHIPLNFIPLTEIDSRLDYYNPIIVTNESFLQQHGDVVKRFLAATSKGYAYCISNADDAVKSLLKFAPETDSGLAVASQRYLADKFKADANRWGEMKESVWHTYGEWMFDNGLIKNKLMTKEAFTNEYLP